MRNYGEQKEEHGTTSLKNPPPFTHSIPANPEVYICKNTLPNCRLSK
jgi:hypothetical protein